jgi:MoaA/NifB/PqqE/SkfB family radical SAM enzyme
MKRIQEWNGKYNAFNSLKALVHVEHWKPVKEGLIPFPRFVSIDPNGSCNFNCTFCNSKEAMKKKSLSIKDVDHVIEMLIWWGTKAVCVGGGGESLLNENTKYLLKRLHEEEIGVGLVTNGSTIEKYLKELSYCKWVGISVDAGTPEVFSKMKGVSGKLFEKVIKNIKLLSDYAPDLEVTYKFLISPDNYKDIVKATGLAKENGCRLIHIRPGAEPWFEMEGKLFTFTEEQVNEAKALIEEARATYEDKTFKVFGVMHKFSDKWEVKHDFKNCYSGFTTCLISSDARIGMCCDRRNDPDMYLGSIYDFKKLWGSKEHIKMLKDVDVTKCPRCTMGHVNEIFENVVLNDKMLYNFY